MQQVLFHIPFTSGWVPPDGVPLYGFGAMLFITFLVTAMIWGPRRSVKVGVPKERFMDMAIVLFITGIAGARIVYMIQYSHKYPAKSFTELLKEFVQIWNGGIVFYGSAMGGVLGFILFYQFVLKKLKISIWKLADVCAPLIALGLAVGRIGCYLNGCCWGQVCVDECQTVPLSGQLGEFPLLPAHARAPLDDDEKPKSAYDRLPAVMRLQTSTGFSVAPKSPTISRGLVSDPRTLVLAVEPSSASAKAGMQPSDRIVKINGEINRIILDLSGNDEALDQALSLAKAHGGNPETGTKAVTRVDFDSFDSFRQSVEAIHVANPKMELSSSDRFSQLMQDWPRGRNDLDLEVQRGTGTVNLTFIPRTVSLFPTQLYETVSMVLLVLLLLAFQPFRRHDGQMIVLMMIGYGAHRFLNEAIRIEPTYALGWTFSQWISIGIFVAAIGIEIYLRKTQPKLGAGMHPLGEGAKAVVATT
jgi:prolipoprotein diacylglyceryltransferase